MEFFLCSHHDDDKVGFVNRSSGRVLPRSRKAVVVDPFELCTSLPGILSVQGGTKHRIRPRKDRVATYGGVRVSSFMVPEKERSSS